MKCIAETLSTHNAQIVLFESSVLEKGRSSLYVMQSHALLPSSKSRPESPDTVPPPPLLRDLPRGSGSKHGGPSQLVRLTEYCSLVYFVYLTLTH